MSVVLAIHVLAIAGLTSGQQLGPTPEIHPDFTTQTCTTGQGCIPRQTALVLDSQWRDLENIYNGESCITSSGKLNKTSCPTSEECARNCALDGADYLATGVEARNDSVTLHMYRRYHGKLINVQPQVYLLEGGDYCMLKLLNQEVSFDVDVSKLPCGMNGAMYLTGMDPSGGRSRLNPAGATYGTGYCDSQCYRSYNFVNGVANIDYKHGTCCNEMDLWEANARSNQVTAHPCNVTGFHACSGNECNIQDRGPCDQTGCGFNPYGLGAHSFYGYTGIVDTNKPFKVVTQFLARDNIKGRVLTEIRRLYVQNGRTIQNAAIKLKQSSFDSITPDFCRATVPKTYDKHGGLPQMGKALKRGMVLVMGIWNDPRDLNRWLDRSFANFGEAGQQDLAIEIKADQLR